MAHLAPPVIVRDARGKTEDNARGIVASMAMLDAYSRFMPRDDILLLFKQQHVATYAEGETERVLVAERGGMLVGVADLMRLGDGWRLVEPLHVRPGHQRMGIGRMLWEKCERTAVDRLAPGIRVVSLHANANANAFYAAMGCVDVGREALRIGPSEYPMIRFEKRLR